MESPRMTSRFKKKKVRDKKYLSEIRGESCLVCGSPPPNHAHHVRHSEQRGFGQKVGDNWVVPLCWVCHSSCHTRGREDEWWLDTGTDPIQWATRRYRRWKND